MYNSFAKYYDILMSDVDYSARTDYILSLFDKFGGRPTRLLDLACGSGEFSNEFARRGISVTGVDISEEMLCIAQEKTEKQGNSILYICQPAQNLELCGRVDGPVCLLDSLNHITNYGELCEVFIKVSQFSEKNSLFIFDMNTPYKHSEVLADNTFVIEDEDVYCVWQNFLSDDGCTTDIILDFFEKDNDKYIRNSECFSERAYSEEEIVFALENAGFCVEAVLGDISDKAPKIDEERMFFVARKV